MKTYFEPADDAEDAKANRGYDVPNYCQNCRRPMMEHYNGQCYTECIDCEGQGTYPSGATCLSCAGEGKVIS